MKTLLLASLLALPAAAQTVTLKADPGHSTAGFSIKHMMVTNVRGEFSKFDATIRLDQADMTRSSVEAVLDTASIDTHNEKRDGHLKSPDFFDAAKCPKITFKSTRIEKGGEGYKVSGDLTMHCQTHPVTLDVATDGKPHKTPFGGEIYSFSATGKLDRKEWGLTWNKGLEAGGVLVGDDVNLQLDLECAPAPAEGQKAETQAETKAKKKK